MSTKLESLIHGGKEVIMEMRPSHQLESDLPLELSQPARRALVGAGYVRLEQLAGLRASEVKQLHGVGPKTLTQLRRALEMLGLSFADEKSQ